MKITDEKIVSCEYCNPDGSQNFPRNTWCQECKGFGFVWLRTVQLDEPIQLATIKIELEL